MAIQHRDMPKEQMHDPYRWEPADEAARLAIVPAAGDEHKLARQASDSTIWELVTVDPVAWRQIDEVQPGGTYPNLRAQGTTAGDVGLASADDTADADKPVSAPQQTALDAKVDKVTGKQLSTEDYTSAEKTKLAALESSRYKGEFASLAALESAHPTADPGDYADVDEGVDADVVRYIWDSSDTAWIKQLGESAALSNAQVKQQYEANADTNAFTDAQQSKLGGIEAGATADMTGAEIKAAYEANLDTNAFTDAEKTKLGGVDDGATANASDAGLRDRQTHTGTQLAATISDFDTAASAAAPVQSNDSRLSDSREWTGATVTQAEAEAGTASTRRAWTALRARQAANAAIAAYATATQALKGLMSAADKTKLDGVAGGATANATDAHLLSRANHTGTQLLDTISDSGTAASEDVGTGATQLPRNSDLTALFTAKADQTALDAVVDRTELLARIERDATLNLDFAGQKFSIYEGLSAGTTLKPYEEIVTHTRLSTATGFDALGKLGSAVDDAPRLVSDPVTGERLGLLVEGEGENEFLQSQKLIDAAWGKTNLTVETTSIPAPTGLDNYERLIPAAGKTDVRLTQLSIQRDVISTISVFFKPQELGKLYINANTSVGGMDATFNSETATFEPVGAGILSSGVEEVADGEYRIQVTVDGSLRANDLGSVLFRPTPANANGTQGVLLFGAQIEEGSTATSYIKTTTAPATRAPDVVSVGDVGKWLPKGGFTLITKQKIINADTQIGCATTFTDGSLVNRLGFYHRGITGVFSTYQNSAGGSTVLTSSVDTGLRTGDDFIAVLTRDSNTLKLFINGTKVIDVASSVDLALLTEASLSSTSPTGGMPALRAQDRLLPYVLPEAEAIEASKL